MHVVGIEWALRKLLKKLANELRHRRVVKGAMHRRAPLIKRPGSASSFPPLCLFALLSSLSRELSLARAPPGGGAGASSVTSAIKAEGVVFARRPTFPAIFHFVSG